MVHGSDEGLEEVSPFANAAPPTNNVGNLSERCDDAIGGLRSPKSPRATTGRMKFDDARFATEAAKNTATTTALFRGTCHFQNDAKVVHSPPQAATNKAAPTGAFTGWHEFQGATNILSDSAEIGKDITSPSAACSRTRNFRLANTVSSDPIATVTGTQR